MAMLLAQRRVFGKVLRPVYMLDSFEGLLQVDERDGPLADAWLAGADPEKFFDNCNAAQRELEAMLAAHAFSDREYKILRGWFHETVPKLTPEIWAQGSVTHRLDGD